MNYDVVGDGEQFLMIERDNTEGMSNYLNVVLNWFEELKPLAPTDK